MNPVSPRLRTLSVEVPSSKRARSGSSGDDNDRSGSPFRSPRSPVIEVPSSLTPKQRSESNFSGSSSDDDIPTRSLIKARSEEIVRSQSNTPISSPLASPGASETAQEVLNFCCIVFTDLYPDLLVSISLVSLCPVSNSWLSSNLSPFHSCCSGPPSRCT